MNPAPDPDLKAEFIAALPPLRAFARTLTGDRARADDLVQQTILKAWAARATFKIGSSFKAWAYTIMRNTFFSDLRKSRRLTPLDEDAYAATALAGDGVTFALELADVAAALHLLPPEQREVLVLSAAGGFDTREIAAIVGIAAGTVKSRISRGRAALRRLLSGDGRLGPRSTPMATLVDVLTAEAAARAAQQPPEPERPALSAPPGAGDREPY
jgi:RNA polymerase sigma-70 factor, ECF subfamily